jgi:hypothetical protein
MVSDSVISKLKKSKNAHIRWRTYAEALASGNDSVIDKLPVKHTDCEFGKWYHGDGQEFTSLDVFKEIGLIHQSLHEEFEIIFSIVTKSTEKVEPAGFFAKLLGTQVRADQQAKAQAAKHLENLKAISMKMIGKLDELEAYLVAGGNVQ